MGLGIETGKEDMTMETERGRHKLFCLMKKKLHFFLSLDECMQKYHRARWRDAWIYRKQRRSLGNTMQAHGEMSAAYSFSGAKVDRGVGRLRTKSDEGKHIWQERWAIRVTGIAREQQHLRGLYGRSKHYHPCPKFGVVSESSCQCSVV